MKNASTRSLQKAAVITLIALITVSCAPKSDKLAQQCFKLIDETAWSKRWGEAFKPCLQAAEQGNARAQYWVGSTYHTGHGTERSYELAARWWLAAARQGDGESQLNIAGLYRDGAGVLKDPVAAHMWYNIAATKDDFFDYAVSAREDMEKLLSPDQLATAHKMAKQCVTSNYEKCD